jgi:hypothetical protein
MDTAMGLGLGIRRPDLVRDCLAVEANPNRDRWREMHAAGLDIPSEPDPIPADEQVYAVRESCRALFDEYYPEAGAKLSNLS